ncbi:phosphate transport system permease protein [Aquisalimonas asiatica]|uniref:Phosphate transport system permease protein n=2 Tax=Aquisalimonas asiatica TaxID=406100 RepID=A0A1H8RTC4_9GAMM|nr:phosphate transport system permease protein [Aquisalimonas asiatica]
MTDVGTSPGSPVSRGHMPSEGQRRRLRRWRAVKDRVGKGTIATFGIGVIGTLILMFVYLFSEVTPIFGAAEMTPAGAYAAPGDGGSETLHTAMERYREVAVRFTDDARAVFFRPSDGEVIREERMQRPDGVNVTSFATGEARSHLVGYGLDDGTAIFARHAYDVSYPGGERTVEPSIQYPEGGGEPLDIFAEDGYSIDAIGVQRGRRGTAIVAANNANEQLRIVLFEEDEDFLTGDVTVERQVYEVPWPEDGVEVTQILMDTTMRNLFVGGGDGRLHYYDISRMSSPRLLASERAIEGDNAEVTALDFLLGAVSMIAGGSDGSVSQWFVVRDGDGERRLRKIRDFESHDAPVTSIGPEHARKGFATAAEDGTVQLHYATSARTMARLALGGDIQVESVTMAPRQNAMLVVGADGGFRYLDVHNPHPEISISALWQKVWYEGRNNPAYVWQSSSATQEFEPKFSLVPLTVGTLKAAFYAMLFAAPLAILAAIYSACFMSPRMRTMTKPTIEIMEALPTVILGFLAGLWAAPFVENNLPAVFSLFLLMPVAFLVMAWVWSRLLPAQWRGAVPPGWEAALLIPVVLGVGWLCVSMSPLVELWFFDGDMRQWLTNQGITYDQRNALVVGMAMGFAVIPTIYSISEDAVFNVPRHLTQGALALGATPWQAVVTVVLLTASPGIFSAVMIGFGRAVGETMIVLMATGNSPVVNFNIFEGMRTLSANIAVEMPEAAVGGTHYRILFLAALVLFVMTFVLNTLAEVVRHRLRKKYSTL